MNRWMEVGRQHPAPCWTRSQATSSGDRKAGLRTSEAPLPCAKHALPCRPSQPCSVSCRNSVGADTSKEVLRGTIDDALEAAGLHADSHAAICLGMSGVDRPDDATELQDTVQRWYPHSKVCVYNDAVAALASGTGGVLHGCVVICGTGTVVLGMRRDGSAVRSGGYVRCFRDPGASSVYFYS